MFENFFDFLFLNIFSNLTTRAYNRVQPKYISNNIRSTTSFALDKYFYFNKFKKKSYDFKNKYIDSDARQNRISTKKKKTLCLDSRTLINFLIKLEKREHFFTVEHQSA